jgi:opacity protein-like surface antigen
MLLGFAGSRKLFDIGASYSRRILLTHFMNWQYDAEILPVALESDPLTHFVNQQTSPTSNTYSGNLPYPLLTCTPVITLYNYTVAGVTYSGTQTDTCQGRQWTIGEAFAPAGMQWNFLPRRKLQPIVAAHGGYMYSTRAIPTVNAGSFNFTFDVGAGFELYRTHSHSYRVEYRYHHISNHDTADDNPGIDNGVVQLSWVFGR